MRDSNTINASQAAELLGISSSLFTYYKKQGVIPEPVIQLGNRFFYSRQDILDWQKPEDGRRKIAHKPNGEDNG